MGTSSIRVLQTFAQSAFVPDKRMLELIHIGVKYFLYLDYKCILINHNNYNVFYYKTRDHVLR